MKIIPKIQNTFTILSFLLILNAAAYSQELEPTVEVNLDQLNIDARDRLINFKQDITDYYSKNKFTDELIVSDLRGKQYKIKCTFQFFFTAATGFDSYDAKVFIGIQRYVFKSQNFSTLIRFLDDKWSFNYTKGQSLYRDDLKFNSLTTFLDYYAFMIIGIDDDSWESELGTKRFQKAQDMVNLAVANGSPTGWVDNSITKVSRSKFPQELLNAKYHDFRKAFWTYHFAGIDSLQWNKRQSLEKMAQAIEMIGKVKKSEIRSFIIKAFFDTKFQEIAQSMVDYYDKTIYRRLSEIDPDHITTYEEFSKK